MCPRHLWNEATGLACDNTAPTPHTHTYHASDAPDRHAATEPEDY